MNNILKLLIIFLSNSATAAAASVTPVRIKTSKLHGLVNFVETVSGEWSRSRTLRDVFEKSRFNDAAAQKHIAAFRALSPHLKNGYTFSGYDERLGFGQNADKALLVMSASVPDDSIDGLATAAQGLMPVQALDVYIATLRVFAPIYDELVWKPTAAKLKSYEGRLIRLAGDKNLADMLANPKYAPHDAAHVKRSPCRNS